MKDRETAVKLLSALMCFYVGAAAIAVVDGLFYNDNWLSWVQHGMTAGITLCLFFLGRENRLCCWAAIFRAVLLVFNLTNAYLFGLLRGHLWMIYMVRAAVFGVSYAAVILEVLAYSKIDPSHRKGWITLLIANIIWGISGGSLNYLVLQQTGGIVGEETAEFLRILSKVEYLVNTVFQLLYICFLYRTMKVVKAKENT